MLVNFVTLTVFFTMKPYLAKAADEISHRDLQLFDCGISPQGLQMYQGRCLGAYVVSCQSMLCAVMLPGPIITPPNN